MDEIAEEVVQRDDVPRSPRPWNLTCSPAFGAGAGNCGGDARTRSHGPAAWGSVRPVMDVCDL
jgi:hypothetical protein